MIMLIKLLGPEYVVWDKAATIEFRKPGRSTLFATFRIDDVDRLYRVDLEDREGGIHASVTKTIYVRRRDAGRISG
jgi:hypothetical protein